MGFDSLDAFHGIMRPAEIADPTAYERANLHIRILEGEIKHGPRNNQNYWQHLQRPPSGRHPTRAPIPIYFGVEQPNMRTRSAGVSSIRRYQSNQCCLQRQITSGIHYPEYGHVQARSRTVAEKYPAGSEDRGIDAVIAPTSPVIEYNQLNKYPAHLYPRPM